LLLIDSWRLKQSSSGVADDPAVVSRGTLPVLQVNGEVLVRFEDVVRAAGPDLDDGFAVAVSKSVTA
jgi:hypothetical protein